MRFAGALAPKGWWARSTQATPGHQHDLGDDREITFVADHIERGVEGTAGQVLALSTHSPRRSTTTATPDRATSLLPAEPSQTLAHWDGFGSLKLRRATNGVPPLFVAEIDEAIVWSTSIRTLVSLGADSTLDTAALTRFLLSGYIQAPLTMARGVSKVRNGHTVDLMNGSRETSPSWRPFDKPATKHSLDEENVRRSMTASIESTLAGFSQPGLLLSGGIDSVALAAVAADMGISPRTYTFRYGEYEGRWNEDDHARDIANRLGLDHKVIVITPAKLMSRFDELVATYEEPFSYGVHSFDLAPLSDDGIDVVITGAIGATWATPANFTFSRRLARMIPHGLLGILDSLARRTPMAPAGVVNTLQLANGSVSEAYMRHPIHRLLSPDQAQSLLREREKVERVWKEVADELSTRSWELGAESEADRFASLGLVSFGPEHLLSWIHRWSEPYGIGTAFPYLDRAYVELMTTTSPSETDPRRDIVAAVLPDEHARRPKLGQTLPLGDWLRGPMSEWAETNILASRDALGGVFDWSQCTRCVAEHMDGTADHRWCLWSMLSVSSWIAMR